MRLLVVTAVVSSGLTAHADAPKRMPPRKPKAAPQAPSLDVRQLMTKSEFQQAGLDKLAPEEVDALNVWVMKLAVELVKETQSKGGCSTPIETNIDGSFEGWDGDTVFKLRNGQIWKQSSYNYTYHYSYAPEVLIYSSGGTCKLKVDGVDGEISVDRLK